MGLRAGALVRQRGMGWWVEAFLFLLVEGGQVKESRVGGTPTSGPSSKAPSGPAAYYGTLCPHLPLATSQVPGGLHQATTRGLPFQSRRLTLPVTGWWGLYLAWEMGGGQGLLGCVPTDQP